MRFSAKVSYEAIAQVFVDMLVGRRMVLRIGSENAGNYQKVLAECGALNGGIRHGASAEWYECLPHICNISNDCEGVTHLVLKRAGQVDAYCQLVPTTGPHPAARTFPDCLGVASYPTGPGIYELTPIVLDKGVTDRRDKIVILEKMVGEVIDFCQSHRIWNLVFATDTASLTWYLKIGLDVFPLGLPNRIAGQTVVPLRMRVPFQSYS